MARNALPASAHNLSGPYFIKQGYLSRDKPEYFDEGVRRGVVWQPDVYPGAAKIAREKGARTIIDVGCGDGEKLAKLHPEFKIVGIDFGPNLDSARTAFPFGEWIEQDLEDGGSLPVEEGTLRDSVVICSDVIEHLIEPYRLLGKLREALDTCKAMLITTPERDLLEGYEHMGPPPNPSHVREWAIGEFASLLSSAGFHRGHLGLTRSNDQEPWRKTILAVVYPST